MNAPANIPGTAREHRIVSSVKAVFLEAHAAGIEGKFFSQAWPESQARARLMSPSKSPMSAIDRRDKTLYFFEEGLNEGHVGDDGESAWHRSYSRLIACDMSERAALRAVDRNG